MNCLTARKIFFSKDANAIDADIGMAKQHINSCHDCRQIIKQQEDFKRLLKKKLSSQAAPTTLRENILSAIAARRTHKAPGVQTIRFKRKTFIASGLAAVFFVLLFVLYSNFFQAEIEYANPVVHALALDHVANNLREHPLDLQTADTAELERWFALRVDFSVRIPALNNATLLGGRLCVVNGERVVYLAYQSTDPDLSGKEVVFISMYIAERSAIDVSRTRIISAHQDQKRIFHGDAKGCNVILWEERGLVYSLVSDMDEDELVKLVSKSG